MPVDASGDAACVVWLPLCHFWALTWSFWWAMFGVFGLSMVQRAKHRKPLSLFTALHIRTDNRPFVIFADMLIASMIGALLAVGWWHPTSEHEALIMGFGIAGALAPFAEEAPNER
jgi:hypothetical protein